MTRRALGLLAMLALAVLLHSESSLAAPASPAPAGPTRIEIPSIKLSAPVEPVSYSITDRQVSWQTADRAVGWHSSSAMPGHMGNTVMSGHNATTGSKVFRKLHKVEIGDSVAVTVDGKRIDYVVTDRVIFRNVLISKQQRAENARWLGHFGDQRLTLVTCYPSFTNTYRLLVIAHPADAAESAPTAPTDLAQRR